MLEVCLLGTGGTVPLPNRWLTSCFLRWKGHSLLVDCGEGTQIALHQHGYSCRHIDTILLTHFHADHTAGLPGLLLTMAKSERTEPVTIYGPKGLEEILRGIMTVARYVPFEIRFREIREREYTFQIDDLKVCAFAVRHSVPCFGYAFDLARGRKFDVTKAGKLNLPKKYWGLLQKEQTVEYEGKTYTPDMVLGEERKGIRLVYTTDTRPVSYIREHAVKADLLIAEGMYGDPEKQEKAEYNKHMTMQESAAIAASAGVKELWFTHYSPSMPNPGIYLDDVKMIFPNAAAASDGQKKELSFED
jgi:ribonuclease Z